MDCFSTSLEGLAVKEGKILKATLTDILQSLLTQSTPVWFAVQVYFLCAAIPQTRKLHTVAKFVQNAT